jgi:hypothetical protein
VARLEPPRLLQHDTTFDLFDQALELIGEIRVDRAVRSYHIVGDQLIGETADGAGVPEVMVWKIREHTPPP